MNGKFITDLFRSARGLKAILTVAFLWAGQAAAQDTVLLSPTGDGGFENGADFASNGWTVENYTSNNENKWYVGNASTPTQGANAAFISNSGGTGYGYNRYLKSRVMFWRDITFPAGYSNVVLTFKVKVQGQWGGTTSTYYDNLFAFFQSGGTAPSVTQPSSTTSQAVISGTTKIATLTGLGTGYVTQTYVLNAGNATAATTRRLIFYWRNFDNGNGVQPPASIDEVSVTASMPIPNDSAAGALTLTPGAGCATFYNNYFSTANAGEPTASCRWQAPARPIWFKFTAPPSGAVRISSDNGGTLTSTRLGLYTASDSSKYSTFNIVHCAGGNGVIASGNNIMYPTGLQAGTTYYLLLDAYSTSSIGTFCITVDEMDGTMLSTTAANCSGGKFLDNVGGNYNGWLSLTDNQGKLNANLRQIAGYNADFSSSITVKSGAPRTDINGQPYLNRNYLITTADPSATALTSAEVKFFFTDAELANLGAALGNLNVSRVPGDTCTADFTGTATLLTQTASGGMNGINWVQVTTPGFSNFFIHAGNTPLPVTWNKVSALLNRRKQAVINWSVAEKGTAAYRVQKSTDGNTFADIITLPGKGDGGNSYSYTEDNALTGKAWYRIIQAGKDGKERYSSIMALQNSSIYGRIDIHPNPATQLLTIETETDAAYSLYDFQGRVAMKGKLQTGNNILNIAGIAKGFYIIKIGDYSQKIVLQ